MEVVLVGDILKVGNCVGVIVVVWVRDFYGVGIVRIKRKGS